MPPIRHYSTSANTKVVRRNAVQQNKGPWGSFFPNAVSRRNVQPDTTDRGFGTYEFGGLLATQFEHLESSIKDREVSLVRSDRADYSFCLKNHKSWDNLLFFNNSKKSSEMLNILKIGSDRGLVTVQPFCGRTGVKLFATVTFSVFLSRSDKVNTIIANLQLQRSLDDATHKKALDTFTVMKSLWPSCPTALEPILSAQAPHQIGPFRGMKPYDQVVKLLKKKGFSGEELFAFTEDIEVGKPLKGLLPKDFTSHLDDRSKFFWRMRNSEPNAVIIVARGRTLVIEHDQALDLEPFGFRLNEGHTFATTIAVPANRREELQSFIFHHLKRPSLVITCSAAGKWSREHFFDRDDGKKSLLGKKWRSNQYAW